MTKISKVTLHIPLNEEESEKFKTAFEKSGLRSQTEFIRMLVSRYLNEESK